MEGAGEGMVAIVQALQDAGLTVTLTNPVGCDHVRRSQAYSGMSNALKWSGHVSRSMNSQTDGFRRCHAHGGGMRNGINNSYQSPHGSKSTGSPLNRHMDASLNSFIQNYNDNSFVADRSKDIVAQIPAREALSTRSSAYWSQRATLSPRSSRGMDAFAESLRKYPCVSPERSTSADIIQRLINYTQSKNLTTSSYHSKSLRSLRKTTEPYDANISKKKSSKNIQTYTRRSPTRETSPYSQELRLNDRKRSLHSPRSDGVRCKESGLSATYDYLKATHRRLSPPRGTEVRYLQDVTKYVRDTLRQICDEQTTTCPKIASRYSQHKRDCPKKPASTSSVSASQGVQTSSPRSRESSTVTQGEDSLAIDRPKTCKSCHRPLPSFSRSPSLRKIRFSATEPCPRYIVREVDPKPECPENDPCPCLDPEEEFKRKLKQHVTEWLNEIPINTKFSSLDKKDRAKIVLDLVDKLMTLRGIENYEDGMRKYVLDCLENLPMWLPPGERAQEVFRNELADNLIHNRLRYLFNTRDKFDEVVAKWVDDLNFEEDGEPVNKEKVVQDLVNILKPLNQYRTDDNDLFRDDLKENILDTLEKLPLHIEGSNTKYYNEKSDNLADILAGLPKTEFDEKDLYKILINHRLKDVDEAKGLKPSERKRLVEQLLENVKDLVTQDMDDDDRKEIIRKVIDDWIDSTHAEPGDLTSKLRKKILDWLHNKPEFSGDSLSIVQDNEKISKDLAHKVKDLLPNIREGDNVKNQLLEDIYNQFKDTLAKRGDQNDLKTTKKLAKDLLNYLVDTVNESHKDKLEEDLKKIVQDEGKKTPRLSSEAKKDVNDQFNDALDNRDQREAPKAMKKLADNLLDKSKNKIQKEKEENPLEHVLRKKIIESLNASPELASDCVASLHDNDMFSRDLAKKMIEVPTEDIDNDEAKVNLLEYINDELNEALKKRQKHKNPEDTKELAKNMLNKLVDVVKKGGKISKIEKDKLKNKTVGSIKAKSKRSNDEPEETKRVVWNWFKTIPELAVGDPSANKELADGLADKVISLKDEGGNTDQKMQDTIDDWLRKTSNTKRVHFSNPQKEKMRRNLMDSLKSELKPSSSLEDDDETNTKVWDWFKEIPKLSEGDNDENKKFVQGLANKLKKYQDNSEDGRYQQKIKDKIEDWLEDISNKKGVILSKKEKQKLINKLADVYKSMPLQKSQSTSADDDEEPSGPLWDWFRDIPELSGDKLENKLEVDALDKQLKKLGDGIVDIDGAEEIEDAIEDWLEDMADKKKVKMYSNKRKQLRKKLMDALYPNYSYRLTSYSDEDSMQKVWDWFTAIPEITGGDLMKNKKMVRKLDDKLKRVLNQDLDEEVAKHKMQGIIDNWLQDVSLIKGERLNIRIKEELRNKLMVSLQTRSWGKRKKNKPNNGPQIRDWFNNIPELSNGNQSDNKKHVDGLIKHLQKIENTDGDKEQNNFKLKGTIDSWLRGMAKKKDAKLNKREIESHRNNLMNALKPKQTNNKIRSPSDEKQKIREWFENISKLSDGNDVENQKLIDDLAKTIEKIHEKNDGNGKIANDIEDEVDSWIKTVSKKKRVRLSFEEVETLKKTLLDSITNKPRKNGSIPDDKLDERQEVLFSDETNSDILDKNANSESLGSDKDTDESSASSNKPKHKATQKIKNKMKAYKSALKGFKDASTDVDEDRRKISDWLKIVPETQFDDESESSLIDKFSTKLKTLRKEGKVTNKKEMNEEVNNWLEDIYKKKGSKLDKRTKAQLIKKIMDSVTSKNRKRNLSSDQSVDDNAQKLKQRASRSPEKTSQTTYNYKDPEAENDLDSVLQSSSSSHTKERKRWNKDPDVRFNNHNNNDKSPTRSIESQLNKNDIDTIMSEDEETASYKSPTLSIKTLELGSPSSVSRRSQSDIKSSPTKPTPQKDLRQLIIGAGIEPKIMPESSYQSPNKSKQNPTIKQRQKSIGRKSSVLKDTTHSDIPLTISETSLLEHPRHRARSDVASRKLIEKTIMKPGMKPSKKKSPSNSNRSNSTRLYYVEESDSNEHRSRRKSVANPQPVQKSSKRSGKGEDSTRTPMKFDKVTKAKISDILEKNIDTVTSRNYADVEEDIMVILTEDADLPSNEVRAVARMIIKQTRRNNGIEDSSDDDEENDVTLNEFDSDSEDDSTDKVPRKMSKARHLVKGVFDETDDFEEDPETQIQLEDAIVDLIAEQLEQGDIDDPTRDALLKLLHDANVPKSVADDICEKVMRRARERPMSFSKYQPSRSPRNRIESALTPNQKLTFLVNAQREIADFYDELTGTISASSRQVIDEAIKDTVAKLADILDDPELTGEQKENMMRNEIIRYLRKLPTQSNVPEEDLANQLMDRVQNIKFISSTPEHSEVGGFHPRRENLDPSVSAIFDENELEANEIRYKETLVDAIKNWSENIDAIKEKVGFQDTMAKDLASEIIDRQKYLQVNPDAKSSEEELEHSKYIIFRWLNRMINLNDLADSGDEILKLVKTLRSISVPKMAEPLKNATSLWALSQTSQGILHYEDPLEADVAEWLQNVPKELYAKDDPYIQEQQIKQFVDTMKKHKGKPNVEKLSVEGINTWLPTMIKADQTVLETMGNQLKNILENHGFVNLPQGQQQLPAKSAMASHEKPPLKPPQDFQYVVGNQQNPQIIPTEHVTSKVNDWVSTLPLNVNTPEEKQHLEKMKQNLILQIKQIGQRYPTTSNEYETKLREPIRFFLQNVPSDPEKKQDDRYLDIKTDKLLLDLGVIPMNTDRANSKFKKAVDVLYDVVNTWCKDLPIYSENPNEDPEKTSALKQNISSKIIYKLGELNMNPEILNDDFLYEDLLLDEVDRQLKDVPRNPELDKYLPALKMELAAKVKDARQKIRDELAGQAYKQQLRDTISTSICLPDNLSPDEQASFEILRDNLADAFINLHYVPDNPEDAKKFKMKINGEINRFCDEFLRRHPRFPVDRRKLTRDLYAALLSVPVPGDESMIHEVEQTRIKDIVNDWMKELPFKDETLTEQLHRNKTASLLAKRIHELENEKVSNPDLENGMFEEISKWLRKQQLRPGQEVYIPEFADRLKNKLKSSEHSRRFDLSARPSHQTQSKLGMMCMGRIPPCTLSREDRSHLQRIRERHGSPCSQDNIVCPRVDSFVQGKPRSPCSRGVMVCPRVNSYSQTDVKPKSSDRGSWCRKELCPGKTQTPTQTSGSYCFTRQKRDASCLTPTQSPYEISPHVIVKEYYWDTTEGSKQQNSFQQTQPPLQQRQGSHTPSQASPPPDNQTPRQSFLQQAPQNYVPPRPQYTTPQPSSSAYQQPCDYYQPSNEEIPCIKTPSPCNTRYRRYFRTPNVSSGDENYPEPGTSRCRRVKVTRLGSLDDTSCQRNGRPGQKKSRSMIHDDDSEWSSVRFPEDGEFWDCPRYRVYGVQGPFIQEKEKRQEKSKCKCKERVLTSCRGRNGKSYIEYDTRRCGINCPHPSYMYFR